MPVWNSSPHFLQGSPTVRRGMSRGRGEEDKTRKWGLSRMPGWPGWLIFLASPKDVCTCPKRITDPLSTHRATSNIKQQKVKTKWESIASWKPTTSLFSPLSFKGNWVILLWLAALYKNIYIYIIINICFCTLKAEEIPYCSVYNLIPPLTWVTFPWTVFQDSSSIKSVWPSVLFRDQKLSICLFKQTSSV